VDEHPESSPALPLGTDPTLLTTNMMIREVAALKELFDERIDAVNVRLAAMDKAQALFETNLTRVPTETDKAIAHLHALLAGVMNERFNTVYTTISERLARVDTELALRAEQTQQAHLDMKEALATALAAAGRTRDIQNGAFALATQKSEESFTKQITALDSKVGLLTEQIKLTITRQEVEQIFRGVLDKLDGPTGLAMRLENLVARTSGRDDQTRQMTSGTQWVIGALIGGAALVIALLSLLSKLH